CVDTLTIPRAIRALDSIPPPAPKLFYVTVTATDAVRIVYNQTDSSEFSKYHVYRNSGAGFEEVHTSTKRNDTNIVDLPPVVNVQAQAYDYAIFVEDKCRLMSDTSSVHRTILLNTQLYSSTAVRLSWSPYLGWDTLKNYEIYRTEDSVRYKLIATVGSRDSIFIDSSLCDKRYTWFVRANHGFLPFSSESNRRSERPEYIYQTEALDLHKVTVLNDRFVYLNWTPGIQPNLAGYAIDRYTEAAGWQMDYATTSNTYFTDKNTDVKRFSYRYRVRSVDLCGNKSPYSNIGTSILLNAEVIDDTRYLQWNQYTFWPEGVNYYEIQLKDNNGVFRPVDQKTDGDTNFIDGNGYPDLTVATCYRILAVENGGKSDTSISNTRCPVLPSRIFLPNAFTPNGDDINEIFLPSYISVFGKDANEDMRLDFRIYNRWGQLVFLTHDLQEGWDGILNGEVAPLGLYMYQVAATGMDGVRYK
ncbi:MAG: gliding motility-associated C-terminal domain-containing protein, partial [Bacteroidota bacterium]|nr:gliding motility-associated C-terminal domain-containing protein [Bacteroidota bacterium]